MISVLLICGGGVFFFAPTGPGNLVEIILPLCSYCVKASFFKVTRLQLGSDPHVRFDKRSS